MCATIGEDVRDEAKKRDQIEDKDIRKAEKEKHRVGNMECILCVDCFKFMYVAKY